MVKTSPVSYVTNRYRTLKPIALRVNLSVLVIPRGRRNSKLRVEVASLAIKTRQTLGKTRKTIAHTFVTISMLPESGSSSLLERVYTDLDLVSGTLLEVAEVPAVDSDTQRWRELGDWLLLAARVNAERVFFLNDDPVVVFSYLPSESGEKAVLDCYRRTWSLARPRYLFLAVGMELRVYSLASPPTAPESNQEPVTPLEIVTRAADIGDQLARFHRERLESGTAFEELQTAEGSGRADQQLLRDVRAATTALVEAGLTPRIAHTLIERAILVRYLEDREILTEDYFESVESRHPDNPDVFTSDQFIPDFGQPSRFIPFLSNKDITYDLFDQLAKDFNGDLFVSSVDEREVVTTDQLRLLMNLLQGKTGAGQEPLFLWAYDFSVIPTNLISTMYELFYREELNEAGSGTHYTPPELVEFVLADVLNDDTLDQEPVVCDPACGSGIFLVEAYRRIVRHEMLTIGRRLSSGRLRDLLLNRIAGCDIDEAAIRLAAFSLYVAFLNYQSPQDIQRAGPLPRLIRRNGSDSSTGPLLVRDAFSRMEGERPSGGQGNEHPDEELPWKAHSFNVVVGNPPWTEIRGSTSRPEQWAKRVGRSIGDRSPSQLFLWRALDLLTDDGVAAFLISAKAMLNTRSTSRVFRDNWLREVKVEHVVNFSRVRRDFFESGVAPFMLVRFRRSEQEANGMVLYETARPVPRGRRGSSALARLDRQVVSQASLRARDYLWKTYSAGSIRDEALVARLEVEDRLGDWTLRQPRAYGFQRARDHLSGYPPTQSLSELRSLKEFHSWGPLRHEWFEPVPRYVKRVPDERLFKGLRLLVRRGVSPRFGPHARLETEPLAFRHTTYAFSLEHLPLWQAKVILGTLLSSLGRYWLYMVSGSWGTWSDEVRSSDLLNMPLRLPPETNQATQRIVEAVDELQQVHSQMGPRELPPQMAQIDEGVAELFELTNAERDLIADFWTAQGPDATRPVPIGTKVRGTEADLDPYSREGIEPYLRVLLSSWNQRLGDSGEFSWHVWRDPRTDVVAVVLETREVDAEHGPSLSAGESEDWSAALNRLGVQWEASQTRSILRYGMVRAVTDTAIVVVKRNEQHLWTATAAWRDADATAAQLLSVRRQ